MSSQGQQALNLMNTNSLNRKFIQSALYCYLSEPFSKTSANGKNGISHTGQFYNICCELTVKRKENM